MRGKVMHAREPDAPDLAKNLRLSMSCHCGNCLFAMKKQDLMGVLPGAARHRAKAGAICNRTHLPCRHRAPVGSPLATPAVEHGSRELMTLRSITVPGAANDGRAAAKCGR